MRRTLVGSAVALSLFAVRLALIATAAVVERVTGQRSWTSATARKAGRRAEVGRSGS